MTNLIILVVVILGAVFVNFYYKNSICPKKHTIEEHDGQTIISYRWIRRFHFFLGFFALFTLLIPIMVFQHGDMATIGSTDLFLDICLLFQSIAYRYSAVVGFVNSTVVRVSGTTVQISHQPLPTFLWRNQVIYNVHDAYGKKSDERRQN